MAKRDEEYASTVKAMGSILKSTGEDLIDLADNKDLSAKQLEKGVHDVLDHFDPAMETINQELLDGKEEE